MQDEDLDPMDRVEDRVKLITRLQHLTQKWAKCSGACDKKDRSEQKQASYSMYCETPLSASSGAALKLYTDEFAALITIRIGDESTYHFKDPVRRCWPCQTHHHNANKFHEICVTIK